MNMRISIKGNEEQAKEELEKRGIGGGVFILAEDNATYWDVNKHYLSQIISWFCELAVCNIDTGFPVGTLLFYN